MTLPSHAARNRDSLDDQDEEVILCRWRTRGRATQYLTTTWTIPRCRHRGKPSHGNLSTWIRGRIVTNCELVPADDASEPRKEEGCICLV